VKAALLIALSALAGPTAELGRHQPVRVDADEVQYAFQKREVTFTGKKPVVLTRDDATLTCRRIVAHTDEAGQIVSAVCTGDVRLERRTQTQVVTCDDATFDNAAERVVCKGNAVLRNRGQEARGERLVYDLRTDEAKLEGTPEKQTSITLPAAEIDQKRRELEQKRKERKK
jgi:lipopolysaccharide export system protein LptA